MGRTYTTESFVEKLKLIHNDSFDYSKVNFIKYSETVEVICPLHGSRFMKPINLLHGHKCKLCSSRTSGLKRSITNAEFILRSKKIYGEHTFDYSKCNIDNGRGSKPTLICKIHGDFITNANDHLDGRSACPLCRKNRKKTLTEILEEFKKTHGNYYNYDKFIFINTKIKGKIICQQHGPFFQNAEVHKKGVKCPKCASIILAKNAMYNKDDIKDKIYKNMARKMLI